MQQQDYPDTNRIEDWPSWGVPIFRWARKQGAVVGYAHSGWGLAIKKEALPTDELPPFDGIGANEYIVSVTEGLPDFISTVDTPYAWELNIWYHTLNAGYRTRISGETDFPCIYDSKVGLGRSYVRQKSANATYDDWIHGIREGRAYVSDGKSHLMDFKVEQRGRWEKARANCSWTSPGGSTSLPMWPRFSTRSPTKRFAVDATTRSPTGISNAPASAIRGGCRWN